MHQRRLARARRAHDGGELAAAEPRSRPRAARAPRCRLHRRCGSGRWRRRRRVGFGEVRESGHGILEGIASAASTRQTREGVSSAPAYSRAFVASASRRPAKPRPGGRRPKRGLRCRRAGGQPVGDVEPDGAVGASASPAVRLWTARSNPTRRPASRPETRARLPAASGRRALDVERHRSPARRGLRVREHGEHGLRGALRRSPWRSMSSWRGLSRPERPLSSAPMTILVRAPRTNGVILEDDAAIVSADDDRSARGLRFTRCSPDARLDPFRADLLLASFSSGGARRAGPAGPRRRPLTPVGSRCSSRRGLPRGPAPLADRRSRSSRCRS